MGATRVCGAGSGWAKDRPLQLWHPPCWVEEATCGPRVPWAPWHGSPRALVPPRALPWRLFLPRTWPASLCIHASSAGPSPVNSGLCPGVRQTPTTGKLSLESTAYPSRRQLGRGSHGEAAGAVRII